MKVFKLPVVVTREQSFGEYTFKAEGVGDYWDVDSEEHDNLDATLSDIQKQLQKKYQEEEDSFGLDDFEIPKEKDIDLFIDQKVKYVTIKIKTEDDNNDDNW